MTQTAPVGSAYVREGGQVTAAIVKETEESQCNVPWLGSRVGIRRKGFGEKLFRDVSVEFTISTAGAILLSIYKLPKVINGHKYPFITIYIYYFWFVINGN